MKPPPKGRISDKSLKSAKSAYEKGQKGIPISKKRSVAREKALKKESYSAASHTALSEQARLSAKSRTASQRSQSAKKAARTRALNAKRKSKYFDRKESG